MMSILSIVGQLLLIFYFILLIYFLLKNELKKQKLKNENSLYEIALLIENLGLKLETFIEEQDKFIEEE